MSQLSVPGRGQLEPFGARHPAGAAHAPWVACGIAAFIAVAAVAGPASALTTRTWIGAGAGGAGTVFGTAANWSPAGAPSSTDSCVMTVSNGATVTIDANATVGALNMSLSGNNNLFRLDGRASTLTVLGSLAAEVPSGNNNTSLELSVGTGVGSAGSMIVNGTASLGTASTRAVVLRGVTGSASQFVFRGQVTFGAGAQTSTAAFPGSYVFDAASAQTVTFSNGNALDLSSVVIGSVNAPTVTFTGAGAAAQINASATTANLTIAPNAALEDRKSVV